MLLAPFGSCTLFDNCLTILFRLGSIGFLKPSQFHCNSMARFRSRSPARGSKRQANVDEVTREEWRTDAPCSTCPVQTGTYSGWDEYGVTRFYCSDCWKEYLHEKAAEAIMEAMPMLSIGDDAADDEGCRNTPAHDTPHWQGQRLQLRDVLSNSPAARSAIVGARGCSSHAYDACSRLYSCASTAPMRS